MLRRLFIWRGAQPQRWEHAATLLLSTVCVAAVLLAAVLYYLQLKLDLALLFNSDASYLPALYRDLFVDGGRLSDWYLTPAPYLFPDWPLYFFLNFIFGDLFHALPAYFVAQGVLLFALALLMGQFYIRQSHGLAKAAPAHAAGGAAWACTMLFSWAIHGIVPFNYFLLSAFHCSVMLLILLVLWLVETARGERINVLHGLLFVITLLACVSDRLFVLQYSLPAALTLTLLGWRSERRAALLLGGTILAGSLVGVKLKVLVSLMAHTVAVPWKMSLRAPLDNWPQLLQMLAQAGSALPVGMTLLGAYYLVLSVLLPGTLWGRGWRFTSPRAARLAVFSWFSCAATLAAVMLSQSAFTVRYFIPAFVLPMLAGPVLLYMTLPVRAHRLLTLALLLPALWSAQSLLQPALRDIKSMATRYYPQDVSCLDDVMAQYDVRHGVATYWDAKRVSLLSRYQPMIAAYYPDLTELRWITTAKVFGGSYDFALVNRVEGLDIERLIALNGAPLARIECGTYNVVVFGRGRLHQGLSP